MEQYDKVIRRKHKSRIFKSKWDWIFYIGLLIIPITQVVIFYFVVNINSILLAFKQYDGASGQFMWSIETLKQMFTTLHTDKGMTFRLVNSVIMYVVSMVVVLPLSLLFSFYIYKRSRRISFSVLCCSCRRLFRQLCFQCYSVILWTEQFPKLC